MEIPDVLLALQSKKNARITVDNSMLSRFICAPYVVIPQYSELWSYPAAGNRRFPNFDDAIARILRNIHDSQSVNVQGLIQIVFHVA